MHVSTYKVGENQAKNHHQQTIDICQIQVKKDVKKEAKNREGGISRLCPPLEKCL
jgi:hypothetical protein